MAATPAETLPAGRAEPEWDARYDLVVLGSGCAGFTSALVAANETLRTLLIEKSDFLGGTTAYSAGTCWAPNNRFLREKGVQGDDLAAARYLDALVGSLAPRELRTSYLKHSPAMIDYLHERCGVRFRMYESFVDYRQEFEGAGLGGRPLEPMPFDGRKLGAKFAHLRWPVPEWGLFGGKMSILRPEADRLLRIARLSPDALTLGAKLVARYLSDRLSHRRGTRLVLGNALIGALYYSFLQRGGDVWLNGFTTQLIRDGDRVIGVRVQHKGREVAVRAARGVVLAGGGFPGSAHWRNAYLRQPAPQFTRACETCTGDTIALGQSVGGSLGPSRADNALWFPSSIARRADGTTAVFPHIWDRAKPGLVAVNGAGRRFVDESVSYHEFTRAMYAAHAVTPTIPAMLVCDRAFLWKYGLGMIRPRTRALTRHIDSEYVYTAATLEDLARRIGVDPAGLLDTVALNNRDAPTGVDSAFGKGSSPYGRQYGDAAHKPNPCLGKIETAPFFAIPVVPTPLGTALGLRTDAQARVLDEAGAPVPGLYACGNDAHNIMGGEYPGGGAQVGAGMTFGYVAALHAAGDGARV